MDKDIKLLLKIIAVCFPVLILLVIFLFLFLFSYQVYQCQATGGDWIFIKESSNTCTELGVKNCQSNERCVLRSRIDDWENPSCEPKKWCKCPEVSKTWYGFKGC